jgi:hypothetical protein
MYHDRYNSSEDGLVRKRPIDLDGSEAFFQYVREPRKTATFGSEYGSRAGNANPTRNMATISDSYDEPTDSEINSDGGPDSPGRPVSNREMRRRAFIVMCVATLATAATAGQAGAQASTVLDFSSELTPNPWLTGTATTRTRTFRRSIHRFPRTPRSPP